MTRINIIPPQLLTDQHLRAEWREISRLPSNYSRLSSKAKIPKEFTLGTGHVLFFVLKPFYTLNRYQELCEELRIRKYSFTDFSENWNVYKELEKEVWKPSTKDFQIIYQRLEEKILMKANWYKYKSEPIYVEDYLRNLKVQLGI